MSDRRLQFYSAPKPGRAPVHIGRRALRLNVDLPGIDHDIANELVVEARQICPYSRATRGNIDVTINMV